MQCWSCGFKTGWQSRCVRVKKTLFGLTLQSDFVKWLKKCSVVESFDDLNATTLFLITALSLGEDEDFRMWVCDLRLSLLAADRSGNLIAWWGVCLGRHICQWRQKAAWFWFSVGIESVKAWRVDRYIIWLCFLVSRRQHRIIPILPCHPPAQPTAPHVLRNIENVSKPKKAN